MDPVLLVSVSTTSPQYRALYSQGRELGRYLLNKLDFKRIATYYSSALPPAVMISDTGAARLISNAFYRFSGQRDIILFAGDGSPVDEQFEYAHSVLAFARRLNVKDVVSIGARWAEAPTSMSADSKLLGFSTSADGVKRLEEAGVTIVKNEPASYFTSLVVAIAADYGMMGYKLSVNHGEPAPHPRSVSAFVRVLAHMFHLDVDVTELEEIARRLEKEAPSTSVPQGGQLSERERRGIYG